MECGSHHRVLDRRKLLSNLALGNTMVSQAVVSDSQLKTLYRNRTG